MQANNPGSIRSKLSAEFAFLENVFIIFEIVAHLACMTLEVFLRTRFGLRYFSIFGFLFVGVMSIILSTLNLVLGPSQFLPIFIYAFVFMGVCHQIAIFQRRNQGVLWHTRYSGAPHGFWDLMPFASEWNVKRFYEPALCYGVTCVAWMLLGDEPLGLYLLAATTALLIRNNMEYRRLREKVLDMIDAQIESEVMTDVIVNMKSPANTKGLSLPGPFPTDRKVRQAMAAQFVGSGLSVEDAIQGLDEEVKILIEPDEDGTLHAAPIATPPPQRPAYRPPQPVSPVLQGIADDPEMQDILSQVQTEEEPSDGESEDEQETSRNGGGDDPDAFLNEIGVHPPSIDGSDPTSPAPPSSKNWIFLHCPTCKKVTSKVRPTSAGKKLPCVICKTELTVPST